MRIVEIRERTIPISRYIDPRLPSGGLTTSLVAIATDAVHTGKRVVGYGSSSVGRFGQSGLIRERFAPRLLAAQPQALTIPDRDGLDPFACWSVMMSGEKLGGHGERCVAVGTLDMAIWDAAAKLASMPLEQFITERLERKRESSPRAFVYAGGGYLYPDRDIACLTEEIRRFLDLGFSHAKIKIGSAALGTDSKRVEAAARLFPGGNHLAVDAMNTYSVKAGIRTAKALAAQDLWWLQRPGEPLAFRRPSPIAEASHCPPASGEALFSLAEAKLLDRYGGWIASPIFSYSTPCIATA